MIGACRVTSGWPNPAIFFLDDFFGAEVFFATVAPFIAYLFVQAFGEGFGETIGDRLCHDCVVVVVVGAEFVAELLQADSGGYRECSDVIGQTCFLRRDEIGERPAWLAAFPVGLLSKEVEPIEDCFTLAVGVEFYVVAYGAGGKEAVYTACCDEIFFDDSIQESIGIGEYLLRLGTLPLVVQDAWIDAFEAPGVEEG